MMFQLSARIASMNRLITNCTMKGDSRPGAAATNARAPSATNGLAERRGSTSGPPSENAVRPHDEDQHQQPEADGIRVGRPEGCGGERLGEPEHQTSNDAARERP